MGWKISDRIHGLKSPYDYVISADDEFMTNEIQTLWHRGKICVERKRGGDYITKKPTRLHSMGAYDLFSQALSTITDYFRGKSNKGEKKLKLYTHTWTRTPKQTYKHTEYTIVKRKRREKKKKWETTFVDTKIFTNY